MLKDLVLANRSYRGYDEKIPVTREQLLDLVDLARITPSSVNMQPLKYYIAFKKEETDKILSAVSFARGLPQLSLPFPDTAPTGYIVICQDTEISPNLGRFQKDVGIAAQTMLLGAAEMGLGGCMIGNFKPDAIKALLGLKETLEPLLVVALGKPNENIVLVEAAPGESTGYYRDENNTHYVPKRRLEDIVING